MSSVVTCALNLTIGLLRGKFRDHSANKLKEEDLTDVKCRQLIARELDDIKTKLDGCLDRKELLSSVCFLKEALGYLCLSQDESADGGISFTQEHKGTTMLMPGCSSLSQAIVTLNITSFAKISFEKSNTKATRVFNNDALSVEDRVTATKLRVMSRIFVSLKDPNVAVVACKEYLKELHDLPAVREMFSQLRGGMKNFNKRNKTKRLENVMSVTIINFVVFDFAKKFNKIFMSDLWNWPRIALRQGMYNPIFPKSVILDKVYEETGAQSPSHFISMKKEGFFPWIDFPQVNSEGEIIRVVDRGSFNVYSVPAITTDELNQAQPQTENREHEEHEDVKGELSRNTTTEEGNLPETAVSADLVITDGSDKGAWFEEIMLNEEDFCIKDECEEFLMSLEWILSFYITGQNDNFPTTHLVITTIPGEDPRVEELQNQFGDDIEKFVEFMNGDDSKRFRFVMNHTGTTDLTNSQPMSGDGIYIKGKKSSFVVDGERIPVMDYESFGSLCTFAKYRSSEQIYALTSYHVLHQSDQNENYCEHFNKLHFDCNNNKLAASNIQYGYRSKADENDRDGHDRNRSFIGTFHKGKYDTMHDLGIIRVDSGKNRHFSFENDPIETNLIEKKVMATMIKASRNGNYPVVHKTGFATSTTQGFVIGSSYLHKEKDKNNKYISLFRKAFCVKVKSANAFASDGDSGSLVEWEDEQGMKRPFAYFCSVVGYDSDVQEREYVCFCLKDSLEACDKDLIPVHFPNP